MHKVQEVAVLLGVSRVTIYKKLDLLKNELHGKHRKINGVVCLDEEAIGIIKANLSNEHIRRASGGTLTESRDEVPKTSCPQPNLDESNSSEDLNHVVIENAKMKKEIDDLMERIRLTENKTKYYRNALTKTISMIDILKKDHRDALTLMDEILDGQLQSKKRELDDKNRIITGYKQIIGYNKERICIIEEKLYTLFK